jgi:hypothetical protein
MDIGQFKKDMARELDAFQKEYAELKRRYTLFITQAVFETDSTGQAELVKQILSVNSELAKHVRDFVQNSKGKFDPALISELTADIIRYQKEFEAIQKSSDKVKSLRGILNKEQGQLSSLHESFNIYLGLFLGLIVVVLLLIFRTSLEQMTESLVDTVSSTSMPEMEYSSETLLGDDGRQPSLL